MPLVNKNPTMFRAAKPSFPRTLAEHSPLSSTDSFKVPEAITQDKGPQTPAVVKKIPSISIRPEESTSAQNPSVIPFEQPPSTTSDTDTDVGSNSPWDRTLQYRPFPSELREEEDLHRPVREDRKIEIGNDPLIDTILQMFPQETETNGNK